MPEFHLDTSGKAYVPVSDTTLEARRWSDLDAFTQGYIQALFFTSEDDFGVKEYDADGNGGYGFGFADLAPEALASIMADCAAFQSRAPQTLATAYTAPGYDETRAGRDLWFTRNGHGVGFWDRSELEFSPPAFNGVTVGDALTRAAKRFGEVNPYLGDDGRVHL